MTKEHYILPLTSTDEAEIFVKIKNYSTELHLVEAGTDKNIWNMSISIYHPEEKYGSGKMYPAEVSHSSCRYDGPDALDRLAINIQMLTEAGQIAMNLNEKAGL